VATELRARLECDGTDAARPSAPPVSARAVAEAHWLAAIHNSNWGQSADIVRFHCDRSLEASADIVPLMQAFLAIHRRQTPAPLSKEYRTLRMAARASAVNLLFNPSQPVYEGHVSWKLITAMEDALRRRGVDVGNLPVPSRAHPSATGALDLETPSHSADSHVAPFAQHRRGYLIAMETTSHFRFWCTEAREAHVAFTFRCRTAAPDTSVTISMNGRRIFSAAASRAWCTAAFDVATVDLRPGLNELQIDWPDGEWDLAEWRRAVAEEFQDGRWVCITPIQGEVHRLRMSDAVAPAAEQVTSAERVAAIALA
jgi:hypothetical protein